MKIEMIASQIMFWGITAFACMIWYQFYKSIDGRMRVLTLLLFGALIWAYGFAGAFYLLWDMGYLKSFPQIYIRLICNAPIVIAMFQWYWYIGGVRRKQGK